MLSFGGLDRENTELGKNLGFMIIEKCVVKDFHLKTYLKDLSLQKNCRFRQSGEQAGHSQTSPSGSLCWLCLTYSDF